MALPLIPILAGLAGVGGGFGLASLFGGTKKETQIQRTYAPTHAPTTTELYAPQIAYTPSYQWMIESPYGTQTSKKETKMASTPSQEVVPTIAPTISPTMTEGADMTKLVLIAAVALVAFGAVTAYGGSKKK